MGTGTASKTTMPARSTSAGRSMSSGAWKPTGVAWARTSKAFPSSLSGGPPKAHPTASARASPVAGVRLNTVTWAPARASP